MEWMNKLIILIAICVLWFWSFLLDYFCLSMRFSLFLISIIRLPEYRR